jgi:hypothetical protein
MRRAIISLIAVLTLTAVFQAGVAYGQSKYGTPKTVLHAVAGKWKADATDEQKKAAMDGLKTMLGQLPGVKNVWLKADRVQPREYHYAFAIEFENAPRRRLRQPSGARGVVQGLSTHPGRKRSQQLTNE